MQQVNIHEAKTHLSKLVEKASQGTPFVIAKAGHPMVKVVPFAQKNAGRLGFLAGEIEVPDDFDTMETEHISNLFEGHEE